MNHIIEVRHTTVFLFVLLVAALMVVFLPGIAIAKKFTIPDFNPVNFTDPTNIDNPFMTLIPGTDFCYEAESEDGTEINEVTVTDCSQELGNVETIVVRDSVRLNGELTEDTYDYFAQDEDGNVWYLGEATKECADNSTEGTWNADVEGAEPGIVMLADPQPGNSYKQEFLEGIAEDMATVERLNANVTDFCDNDCLKTKEWSPLEHGSIEHKYYAQDIVPDMGGLVLTEELKGKTVLSELFDVITDVADTGFCPVNPQDALDHLCNDSTPPPMNCSDEL
jgi:hypothetical protein